MKQLKPKYAQYNNDKWDIVCEDNSHRTVTKGQWLKCYAEPEGRLIILDEKWVNCNDEEYIDYMNTSIGKPELLVRLEWIINVEQRSIERLANMVYAKDYFAEDEHTDHNQTAHIDAGLNLFGQTSPLN